MTGPRYATTPYDRFGEIGVELRRIDGELDYLSERQRFGRRYEDLKAARQVLVAAYLRSSK
jgi:hypothetical protein